MILFRSKSERSFEFLDLGNLNEIFGLCPVSLVQKMSHIGALFAPNGEDNSDLKFFFSVLAMFTYNFVNFWHLSIYSEETMF